jgi:hypothetical protein
MTEEKEKLARTALIDAANREISKFTGDTTEHHQWLSERAYPLLMFLERIGQDVEHLGYVLPMPALEELLKAYLGVHRYAFALWQHRTYVETLLAPTPRGVN